MPNSFLLCLSYHYNEHLFLCILPLINTFPLFNSSPCMFCSVVLCRHRCSACRSPRSIHRSRRDRHWTQSNGRSVGRSVGHFLYHYVFVKFAFNQFYSSSLLFLSVSIISHQCTLPSSSSPRMFSSLLFNL
jgi:hypothetical protein